MPKESCEGLPWVFCFSELSQRRGGILFGSLTQGPSKGFHGFFERVFGESPAPWFDSFGEKGSFNRRFWQCRENKGVAMFV